MSGMVLTQILNPEKTIDRQGADKALDSVGNERADTGPSRYDEIVRQQEKRLEDRRARERAAERDRQADEALQRQQAKESAATKPDNAQAANERRPDAESARSENADERDAEASKATSASKGSEDDTVSADEGAASAGPLDQPDVDDAAVIGLAFQAQVPEKALSPQGQSSAQVMASLTGTGQTPGGLPTGNALFAAMLEAGKDKGSQGSDLLAGLKGGNLQSLSDTAAKVTDTLTTQVTSRLAATELTQPLNHQPTLRGTDAQSLMRSYSTSVEVPVGADEWGEKVMGKLAWLTASQMSVAEIHITPPDMGPLEVRVQVQNDQAAVTVHATTPAVREQLELHGHRLREMLSEQGLSLEGFDVSDSPGRETADSHGEDDGSGDRGQSGQALAGNESEGTEALEGGELDLSWKGELDLYA